MKQLWKSEDRAMDRLLRGHVSQHLGPKQICKQFDPDLANAYIEQRLTTTERAGFEQHLSLCAACRTATVALHRLASAEASASLSRPRQQAAAEGWRERLGAFAGAMTTPRWAMAATAVIVLAMSMPVLFSRKGTQNRTASHATEGAAEVQSVARSDVKRQPEARTSTTGASVGSPSQDKSAGGYQADSGGAAPKSREQAEPHVSAKNESPGEQSAKTASKKLDDQKEKAEAADAVAPAGVAGAFAQTERQAASQQQAPSPPKHQAAIGDQLAKVDPEGARRLPEAEKDSAQVSVLKSGRADGEARAGEDRKIRPEDNNAPASPIAVQESAARRALAQPSASSMRDGRLNAASRGTDERKIGKKRFWLRDNVWTDNDYRPEKEMPMVTIVRDSDVFKEVIGKRATLKGYLTAFAVDQRVVVVYKGTIYKLIPQQDNK